MANKRIFIAILDWGLGHASRCIPLINALQQADYELILGSSGRAMQLVQAEFPNLKTIELPAYNIWYISNKMWFNIAWQWPKIIWSAWREYRMLQKIIDKHQIELVISDSRFGCFSTKVPCIFMTHQLYIRIPFPPLQYVVNWINHYMIGKFTECWIPDNRENGGLAGALSHPSLSMPTWYLGVLSRMKPLDLTIKYPLIAVLSGPEPQRSKLEEKLILQATELKQKLIIVQGKTEDTIQINASEYVLKIPFYTSTELNQLMEQAKLIICRPGYTSLMDLTRLGKKALLIPTPGQTEQEYLAKRLQERGICYTQNQENLNLEEDIKLAGIYPGFTQIMNAQSLPDIALKSLLIKRIHGMC